MTWILDQFSTYFTIALSHYLKHEQDTTWGLDLGLYQEHLNDRK